MSDDEPIAVLDAAGAPLLDADGRPVIKPRDLVHRDGDWHAATHLWVVCADGVILQRRGAHKQAWPSRLDASAAGHLLAGEAPLDGLREAEEELGVRYRTDEVEPLGVFPVDEAQADGTVNREHQHVFCVRDPRPLRALDAFDRDEVAGLVAVDPGAFAALVTTGAPAAGVAWDGTRAHPVFVTVDELVPAPYLAEIAPLLAG